MISLIKTAAATTLLAISIIGFSTEVKADNTSLSVMGSEQTAVGVGRGNSVFNSSGQSSLQQQRAYPYGESNTAISEIGVVQTGIGEGIGNRVNNSSGQSNLQIQDTFRGYGNNLGINKMGGIQTGVGTGDHNQVGNYGNQDNTQIQFGRYPYTIYH